MRFSNLETEKKAVKYVFGPVPSRRLGQSLGIDPVPLKTCNWNCVYCQLGRTKPLTNERKDYFPLKDILYEVQSALSSHEPGEIDWITFVGSGETTLHAGIGWLIDEVKKITGIPVAVITNGSLLFVSSVRSALLAADAVLPGLDAGTPELYKKINRPHPDISFEDYIQGLITFRQEFQGKFWIEVMLMQGVNDTREALEAIAEKMALIKPDKIHIGVPYRPPVEVWVKMPDESGIMRATSILGEVAEVVHPQEGKFDLEGGESIVDGIINVITRHPMSDEQLQRSLDNYPPEERIKVITELKASPRAKVVKRYGKTYWSASKTVFPDVD